MDKLFNVISVIFGVVGGVMASIFGNFDTLLWALMVLMILDYVTGIIKAVYLKQLSSDVGFKG